MPCIRDCNIIEGNKYIDVIICGKSIDKELFVTRQNVIYYVTIIPTCFRNNVDSILNVC